MAAARLDEIAQYLTPRMRRALNVALAHMRNAVNLGDVVDALDEKDFYAAARALMAAQPAGEAILRSAFSDALAVAGRQFGAAAVAGLDPRLIFQFAVGTPASVEALDRLSVQFMPDIFGESEKVLRRALADGLRYGDNPVDVARDVRQYIGFTEYDYNIVQNFENKLRTAPGDAFANTLRDHRYDSTVAKAARGEIELSDTQIGDMVDTYASRLLNWRTETASRTMTLNSVREGQLTSWLDAAEAADVPTDDIVKTWITTIDGRERPEHHDADGMTVGIDEEFDVDGGVQTPGEGVYNCRCTMTIRVLPANATARAEFLASPDRIARGERDSSSED